MYIIVESLGRFITVKELLNNPIKFFKRRFKNNNIILYLLLKLLYIFFILLFLPLSIILLFTNYRVSRVFHIRIGHYALETFCLLNDPKYKKYKIILTIDENNSSNKYFKNIINKHFIIFSNTFVNLIINALFWIPFLRIPVFQYARKPESAQLAYKIFKQENLNFFNLPENLLKEKKLLLNNIGLRDNDWYVCFNCRNVDYSRVDNNDFKYRNSNTLNLIKSLNFIISEGGWVITIGTGHDKKDLIQHEKFFNYENSSFKNNKNDIILASNAAFFLGDTSGIHLLSTVFNVPSMIVNSAPFTSQPFMQSDMYIFKKYFNKQKNRYMKLEEVASHKSKNFFMNDQYIKHNIELIENSEEEIYNFVKEFYEKKITKKLSNKKNVTLIKHIIEKNITNKDYGGYGNFNISDTFIEKNKFFFNE